MLLGGGDAVSDFLQHVEVILDVLKRALVCSPALQSCQNALPSSGEISP